MRSAIPRENEPDRPRILTDGGQQDRSELKYDEVGNVVESINAASLKPTADGEVKWHKEIKPMHSDAMIGIAVLLHLGSMTGETLYFFTD